MVYRKEGAGKRRQVRRRRILLGGIVAAVLVVLALFGVSALLDAFGTGKATVPQDDGPDQSAGANQPGEPLPGESTGTPDEPQVPAEQDPAPEEGPGEEILPPEGPQLSQRDGVTYLVIDGYEMLLVNKNYSLPADYGDGITPEAQQALDAMFAAAAGDGVSIWVCSGFRSYDTQEAIFARYVARDGEEAASRYSARPGQSEHQSGLAVDLDGAHGGGLTAGFANTPEFAWLSEHAAEYGFILRYHEGKEWATGYIYEPWHYRYVGVELAGILRDSGLTVEEYAGLV